MEQVIQTRASPSGRALAAEHQAYQLLHWAFVLVPAIAGADKFFHYLTNWDQYLAPGIPRLLHIPAHTLMLIVGAVELVAAVIVAVRPKIGGLIVAVWLALIIISLLMQRGYYDIALRDFGLFMAAIAMARLGILHDRPPGTLRMEPT